MTSKIKIIHIISNLSLGGAQILLFDILNTLKSINKYDLYVITFDSGEFIEKFQDAGIKVIDLKEKGLFNLRIYFKLKRILKEINADIVHTHLNKADFYGRIAAKQTGVKIIFSTCHNYSTHHKGASLNKKSFFDVIDNFVIKFTNCNLIAISKVVKQYLVNRNPEFEKKTEVIYNGINIQKENYLLKNEQLAGLRKDYVLNTSDFVISILGRLEKQKGHLFFLESIKDFLRQYDNIKILIIGEGSLRNELEKFLYNSSLIDKVKMLGFKKDVESIIEMSDLIAVPSLWEGFGLVILEGMIKRKLILASDVGGITEIIENGKTGFLFESRNKKNLIEKIDYIYNHLTELNDVKENAVLLVKEKFNVQINSQKYVEIYDKSLKKYFI